MKNNFSILFLLSIMLFSCHGKNAENDEEELEVTTPVTITHITVGEVIEVVELSATSVFLQRAQIKATTNGYLKSVDAQPGQQVSKGQVLFVLKGKEAENIGTIIHKIDPDIHFTGEISITSNCTGFITAVHYHTGDYVMEGNELAEIMDASSLVFMMQIPYELTPYLAKNKTLDVELPDGTLITGTLNRSIPTVDPVSQTQSVVIRIPNNGSIPENLIAKVKIIKNIKHDAVTLPKAAILADETLEHFWIMKVIDDEYAIKVPIIKGIETAGMVEIVSPELSPDDIILVTGNYGLPDMAKIVIHEDE